ncbi:hypothetical protein [Motiliproteus sp. SC1-56]|uniref:hypothetical protein n=1 Tax=Motiliproteus sp. SC1-56 TaxID=2799565 RepID=UPI001A8F740A|nr:hypothetical protein [Motiliproteus sp. SC1-56]
MYPISRALSIGVVSQGVYKKNSMRVPKGKNFYEQAPKRLFEEAAGKLKKINSPPRTARLAVRPVGETGGNKWYYPRFESISS